MRVMPSQLGHHVPAIGAISPLGYLQLPTRCHLGMAWCGQQEIACCAVFCPAQAMTLTT